MRKLLRDAAHSWKQFLAIVAMGAIAMTLFLGLLSNAQSLSERVERFYAAGNTPDIWAVTTLREDEDAAFIKSILDEGDEFGERFLAPGKISTHSAYALVEEELPTVSYPVEIKEQTEEQTSDHFLIVDYALTTKGGASLGDPVNPGDTVELTFKFDDYLDSAGISFDSFDQYLKDGGTNFLKEGKFKFNATVTGSMLFGENIQQANFTSGNFLISQDIFYDALQQKLRENYQGMFVRTVSIKLGRDFPQPNEYLIKLADLSTLEAKENAIRTYFESKFESTGSTNFVEVLDRSSNPWSITIDNEVREAIQLSFVFPVVFFLVAVLVILTTMSQLIFQQRTQIGTMKALGVRKSSIYGLYLGMVGSLVTIATFIGCILGPIIIPSIMGIKYDILFTLPARSFFVFPWWQALLTFAAFALISFLVTVLVIKKEIALSPAESMRPPKVEMKSRVKLSKQTPFALAFAMAIRNIRISLAKSIMVVVGVAGCTALLICGFGIQDTLDHGIDVDIDLNYTASLNVSYAVTSSDDVPAFADYPEVEYVDQYYSVTSTVKANGKSFVSAFRLYSDDHPYCKVDIPKGKVAISSKIVNEIGARVGDTIEFSYNGSYLSAEVGAVYESFTFNGVNGLQSDFLGTVDKLYTACYVRLAEGVDPDAFAARLVEEGYASSAESITSLHEKVDNILGGIKTITAAVKVFAILLAVVVLYNLALENFNSHSRDIATMKVLGFSQTEIAVSLMSESLILTIIGIAFGAALGYPFLYAVLVVNTVSLVQFLYFINWATYLFAFALTFLVGVAVNLYLSFLIRKVQMVSSLKSVE
ncbi:MAG: ABC transporter permease [Bacilli bacterium]|nr:ABC transporter permease [Bacilli bacterium]